MLVWKLVKVFTSPPKTVSYSILRSSTVFGPIRTQAYEYAKAVDFSITAAQNGFDFCEDILAYAEDFDVTDEAVRQEALQDLWELAKQGSENAHRASWSFRGTRQTVSKVIILHVASMGNRQSPSLNLIIPPAFTGCQEQTWICQR